MLNGRYQRYKKKKSMLRTAAINVDVDVAAAIAAAFAIR